MAPSKDEVKAFFKYYGRTIAFFVVPIVFLPVPICIPGQVSNIKNTFTSYEDSHVKDKTVERPSYLQHGDPILVRWHLYNETAPNMSQCKDGLSGHYHFHCKDKTVTRPSYFYNDISCAEKTVSLYWDGNQITATSHERHGVWPAISCSNWHQNPSLLALSKWNPLTYGFPHKGSVMRKDFPCHDVIVESQNIFVLIRPKTSDSSPISVEYCLFYYCDVLLHNV